MESDFHLGLPFCDVADRQWTTSRSATCFHCQLGFCVLVGRHLLKIRCVLTPHGILQPREQTPTTNTRSFESTTPTVRARINATGRAAKTPTHTDPAHNLVSGLSKPNVAPPRTPRKTLAGERAAQGDVVATKRP